MLKHLPQLVKFKTAMDVRIGVPNEHLSGNSREEISQPMFATSVGLIMRGFEYLETYKSNFNAGEKSESGDLKQAQEEMLVDDEGVEIVPEEKMNWRDKFKSNLSRMFETEDQSIN
jgi:cell division protein FtsA